MEKFLVEENFDLFEEHNIFEKLQVDGDFFWGVGVGLCEE
jgi:hypothetical protein